MLVEAGPGCRLLILFSSPAGHGHDEQAVAKFLANAPAGREPIHLGHANVENDDIGAKVAHERQPILAIVSHTWLAAESRDKP